MSSVWREGTRFEDFPTLEGDAETDVLIIGGGIVGILTAYFLDECGIPYILVEKNKLCGGTTQNTTAKITYSHGLI
ncbi:MAG: FAD-dependent oxidoreductase, partial [Clostridia bacterium]|nr:FAD-dependent oxidoreductase [Clostridia bacterium]